MSMAAGVLLCLGFLVGMVAMSVWWGLIAIALLGLTLAYLRYLLPRTSLPIPFAWRTSPSAITWCMATIVALVACLYGHWRIPAPGPHDISTIVDQGPEQTDVTVTGKVTTVPRVTRSQKRQFQLQVDHITQPQAPQRTRVTGKLYVTVPVKQARGLHPSQTVTITGVLYRPRRQTLPKGFDFAAYLSRSGIFAAMTGQQVEITHSGSTWGLWAVRQRIIQAQQQHLGKRKGAIVSAMVLGGRTVDIPFDIRDRFTQVGLAHALAASGFHVSILLALILALTQPFAATQRAGIGAGILLLFGALNGFSPSVSRAVLMGIASVLALAQDRRTRPVPILLGVAVVLLFLNPVWLWDWGFQYSFLATFGLLVTLQPLLRRLDWLPPTLATLIAVPLAATAWTLPLQLYYGGWVPVYGLLANILATVLLSVLTVGGFISGLLALVWPTMGSLCAWGLHVPAAALIWLIQGIAGWPGSTVAVGTLALWQLTLLYGLFLMVWLWPGWQPHWQWRTGLALLIIVLPLWQTQINRFQVTLLQNQNPPIMVIQQPDSTILINAGNPLQAALTVVPFLHRQGVNRVDLAIATDTWPQLLTGWQTLIQRLPVTTLSAGAGRDIEALEPPLNPTRTRLQSLQMQQTTTLGQVGITLLRTRPAIVDLDIAEHHWLLVRGTQHSNQAAWLASHPLPTIDVLWWVGGQLSADLLEQLHPKLILATTANQASERVIVQLQQQFPQFGWQQTTSALQWTPEHGATAMVSPGDQTAEVF